MYKIWVTGYREYMHHIRTRGFWLGALGLPLIFSTIWLLPMLMGGGNDRPATPSNEGPPRVPQVAMGVVDQAGIMTALPDSMDLARVELYPDVAQAATALDAGRIDLYYIIPPDYRETGQVRRVSPTLPSTPPDNSTFNDLLVRSLLPDTDATTANRLRRPFNGPGPDVVILSEEGAEEGQANSFLPFIVAFAVMVPLFTAGGYLLQSLAEEKSSRIIEMLLVSLRPRQLLAGKLAGLGVLTLTLYLIWGAVLLLLSLVFGQSLEQALQGVNLSTAELLLIVPYALGGFILYAGIMAGIGALGNDLENSRAWVFVITLPMLIPIYLWLPIVNAPNGPLAVTLSILPFSAPIAMLMRMTSAAVPLWQIGASLVVLFLTGMAVVSLMGRLFRVQTLLSGESISLRRMWQALTVAE